MPACRASSVTANPVWPLSINNSTAEGGSPHTVRSAGAIWVA